MILNKEELKAIAEEKVRMKRVGPFYDEFTRKLHRIMGDWNELTRNIRRLSKKQKKHERILAELKRKLKVNHQYCEVNDDIPSQYMTGSNRILIEMIHFIEELNKKMIDTKKNIRIYDDTGNGDGFEVKQVLYEDDDTIIANVVNHDWYDGPLKVTINKNTRAVSHSELRFYYAENY